MTSIVASTCERMALHIQSTKPVRSVVVTSSFVASVLALEATLGRLDESFSFAVECMQTDMAAAKAELAKLKAMLPAN